MGQTIRFKEHMFRAAKANTFCAEIFGGLNIKRCFSISANTERAGLIRPCHNLGKIAGKLRLHHINCACENLSAGPVHSDDLAFFDDATRHRKLLRGHVDADITCARDTRLTHAARDHGRVRGHAAPRRDDSFGGVHAVNIFRACFSPYKNDLMTRFLQLFGLIRGEHHFANRGARRRRKAHSNNVARRVRIQGRVKELIERERFNPHQSFIFCNLSRLGHINSDF